MAMPGLCPFCGGSAFPEWIAPDGQPSATKTRSIVHYACRDCRLRTPMADTEEAARMWWNDMVEALSPLPGWGLENLLRPRPEKDK